MATKLTTSIHREVNLKDENGTPHDYIVTLKQARTLALF